MPRTNTYTIPERIIPEQTITDEIYEYDELDEEAKRKVKDWLYDIYHTKDGFIDMCETDIKNDFPNSKLSIDYEFGYRIEYFTMYGKLCFFDVVMALKDRNEISSDEYAITRYCCNRYDYYDYVEFDKDEDYAYCINEHIEYIIDYLKDEYDNNNQPIFDDPTRPEASSEDVLIKTLNKVGELCINFLNDFIEAETAFGTEYFWDGVDDEEASEICYTEGYEFYEDGELYEE